MIRAVADESSHVNHLPYFIPREGLTPVRLVDTQWPTSRHTTRAAPQHAAGGRHLNLMSLRRSEPPARSLGRRAVRRMP